MGKKKRRETTEAEPSLLDRVLASRPLTIGLGIAIVAAFAGLAILVVTLLGGEDLGDGDNALSVPGPIGPPPEIERSAAADLLANKTWDDMTAGERQLVEDEVKRVFGDSTFRARSGFVAAVDVFRRDGATVAARTYPEVQAAGGTELGTQTLFYCTEDDGEIQAYRYITSSAQRDFYEAKKDEYIPSWGPILSATDWSNVRDVGFRDADGTRLHGLELDYIAPEGQAAGLRDRVQYWFDVETARLIERGRIIEGDPQSTEANWYRLRYDELPPPLIPADLEQPPCVQEIMAAIAP